MCFLDVTKNVSKRTWNKLVIACFTVAGVKLTPAMPPRVNAVMYQNDEQFYAAVFAIGNFDLGCYMCQT